MPDVQDIVAEVLRDDEYVLGTFGDTGPQGEKGDQGEEGPQGPAGPSNVLSIGTVVRGDDAAASITGTSPNQILNLTLPKGDQGIQGPEGPTGFAPIANVTKSGDTVTISITDKNGTTTESLITSYQEPLLSCKWSDHLLNDISWLRADTFSWQSGETYLSVYQHLLDDIGYVRYMIPNDDIQEKFYRSPSDDTTMYAWTNQYSTLYTESEFPENGDDFYYHNQVSGTVLSTGTEAGSGAVTPTTETIAGTTITYYPATDGHKIVLADQETTVHNIYNATGVARYFILDTANTRFKLPRWKHNKYQAKAPVVGNGTTLGLTNGNINGGLYGTTVNFTTAETRAYNTPIGTDLGAISGWATTALGVTTDATKSGIEATLEEDDMYLYFYVGNFSQSATEQTAGLNSELFNAKVDLDGSNATFPHIIETYDDGNGNGYRVWSDKWCEQYGYVTGTSSYGKTTVNLLKEFKDTYYITSVAIRWGTESNWYTLSTGAGQSGVTDIAGPVADITTTSFSIQAFSDHKWEAKGYIN